MTPPKTKRASRRSLVSQKKKHLTPKEFDRLLALLPKVSHRHLQRNHLLLFMMYRHGLRVSEAIDLTYGDLDFKEKLLKVHRLKGCKPSLHPMTRDELKLITEYLKSRPKWAADDLLFASERGAMCRQAVNHILRDLSRLIGFRVTPHMLRHSCGYYLINKGTDLRTVQEYLGHRDINSTVIYTELDHSRFKGLFR